ncbi:MAG: hypothetical protein MUE85_11535 [Microscillaceae bacterium]|nr:hypothetical protein [Microscillaceae bacterium]
MEKKSYISLKIEGRAGGQKLTPEIYDIADLRDLLSDIEALLFPTISDKKNRPIISYTIEEGSIVHKFLLPYSVVISFLPILKELNEFKTSAAIETKRIAIVEKMQKKAVELGWTFNLTTSESRDAKESLLINSLSQFEKPKVNFIRTELIIYGYIFEAGGLHNSNIHLYSQEFGRLIIATDKEILTNTENRLYKTYGMKVEATQNIESGELSNLKLIEFVDYNPIFDEQEFEQLLNVTTPILSQIKDKDAWLAEVRGNEVSDNQ